MRRPKLLAVAAVASLALFAGSLPGGANANAPTGPGSAESRAAQVDAGAIKVVPTVDVLGLPLSGLLGAVTSGLVNPLLALPNTLTSSLANSLVGAGLRAGNPSTQQPRPAPGEYPVCGTQGWTSTSCYGPLLPTATVPGLLSLATGGVQGYATGDADGYAAAAHAANPVLSLFGQTIGDLGVADSSAACTTTTCTAGHTLTGGSLFGGALTYGLASGSLLAKIGTVSVGTVPLQVINGVTAVVNGDLLTLKISLTLTQLLGAIGTTLTALGTLLGGLLVDVGTTANLVVTIGPGNVVTGGGGQSSAWGLAVGIGLSADIRLRLGVLGIPVANIGVAATGTQPNLTDLKLAYSTGTAGGLLPGWVPPVLI